MNLIILLFLFSWSTLTCSMESNSGKEVSSETYEELKPEHSTLYHIFNALNLSFGNIDQFDQQAEEKEKKRAALDKKYDDLYALLINKTEEFVKDSHNACMKFANEAQRMPNLATINLLVKRYETTTPIFLLNECFEIENDFGCDDCKFSRLKKPQYRNQFDEQVSNSLIKILKGHPDSFVEYVGFSAGLGLPDLIILTKILHKFPTAKISIHLIDMIHKPFQEAYDELGKTREIKPGQNIYEMSINPKMPQIQNLESVYKSELMNKQFLGWLNHFFKKGSLRIFAHGLSKEYIAHQKKHSLPVADIVTAADMEDEECKKYQALDDYEELCKTVLTSNPQSKNFLLCTEPTTKKIKIKKYDLENGTLKSQYSELTDK